MSLRHAQKHHRVLVSMCGLISLLVVVLTGGASAQTTPPQDCERTVKADVVAFDQVFFYNRLGAVNPAGMMYALKRDVVPIDAAQGLVAGNVRLRADKRPRPLVLRMNANDCLQINFQNLLDPNRADDNQPNTRTASVHVTGLQLVHSIADDGSNVGQNPSSLVAPNGSASYTFYAQREGNHLLYSTAATTGGEGNGGSLSMGLFGSVNVEADDAKYYRSQLTAQEMVWATKKNPDRTPKRTPAGQPVIDYDAVYPAKHPRANTPILKILDDNHNTLHSDLNAIITGPGGGRFEAGTYRPNATEPDRDQPFREFTVIYHDEIKAVQAFDRIFEDPVLSHTLHSVRDAFAINYGTGGIGAEILANRFKVGPMGDCTECLYEDFFLSAWAVGDPAQIVDVPASREDINGQLIPGPKATKVFFPDDPSNVHHSYLSDHVKFRVVHAGPKEHHIHHLHAHQWLNTPDSDNSTYLDSQALGPGASFTTEITHNGGGNRNKTPGDAIFHCHFYPHFAQGMWELWRVHDVFEEGTVLDGDGRPTATARALPDGEISKGTPIPALVPLPTIAMAPVPQAQVSILNGQVQISGTGNPGFPFFVPGVAGHRVPQPPLDMIDDGGLPRHVILGGAAVHHQQHLPDFDLALARLDFDKSLVSANARAVPQNGTPTEVAAMNFHAVRNHPSYTPEEQAANFVTNGRPAAAGAPFADPCVDDAGNAFGNPRLYKSANIQIDLKLNKRGWHLPQSRISALWGDVADIRAGQTGPNGRPPEPLFFRANTEDCVTLHFTNLVPRVWEQDEFQVRTPTDTMGQHIHLVKFDVLASDGAANGFNYEDGSFAPEEVIERITAINALGGLLPFEGLRRTRLTPRPHPYFGTLGAQTTVQRWFADNVLNNLGKDRTLRTVFTHDHFGPSTHQQAGLYAGLVIEPKGSTWKHNETGQAFGGRFDGGPTSWQAIINTSTDSYREFLLEFADFQLAYREDGSPVNPPARKEIGLPFLVEVAPQCPGGAPRPCPEAVSADDVGTMSVNYRNEPLALRVRNPATNAQAAGEAGDLSNAYRSDITRADNRFNVQPDFYRPLTRGVRPGDPFTPLIRANENDKVQVRILVGAHEEGHNFGIHGMKWLFEPSDPNSGWRNNQMMGISEHFEIVVPRLPTTARGKFSDFLYMPGAAIDDQWNGLWGLMRVYRGRPRSTATVGTETESAKLPPGDAPPPVAADAATDEDLPTLASNPEGMAPGSNETAPADSLKTVPPSDTDGTLASGSSTSVCPAGAPQKSFDVTAVAAQQALPGGTLVYNQRTGAYGGRLHDPTALMFFRTTDLTSTGRLITGRPIEPLVLRARAGDCLNVTLRNRLPETPANLAGFSTLPMIVDKFNANQLRPSNQVGLHPQLVHMDVRTSNGVNVGFNPVQTPGPGQSVVYQWYAGDVNIASNGARTAIPIEFGATGLSSSDPIKHSGKGLIGALIIEPQGSSWTEDTASRASATVTKPGFPAFRDFVVMFQNDVNLRMDAAYYATKGETLYAPFQPDPTDTIDRDSGASPPPAGEDQRTVVDVSSGKNTGLAVRNRAVPNLADAEDAEDSGQKGVNYRTEPLWKRMGFAPDTPLEQTRDVIFTNALSNAQVGGNPVTPVFTAAAGTDTRFRVLLPGGHARNGVFALHGHVWEQEPYTNSSKVIGTNPLSEWKGATFGIGPQGHHNIVLKNGAGGNFRVTGDYLYRTQDSFQFDGGIWGIFRVN